MRIKITSDDLGFVLIVKMKHKGERDSDKDNTKSVNGGYFHGCDHNIEAELVEVDFETGWGEGLFWGVLVGAGVGLTGILELKAGREEPDLEISSRAF